MGGKNSDLAEGTEKVRWNLWHQIGHERQKSTGEDFGGALETSRMPWICGQGRGSAADRKSLGKEKIAEGGARREVSDLRLVLRLKRGGVG